MQASILSEPKTAGAPALPGRVVIFGWHPCRKVGQPKVTRSHGDNRFANASLAPQDVDRPQLFRRNQSDYKARCTRPRGSTGTVKIGLRVLRRVVMDHRIHPINVNPASGNVRRHEHGNRPIREAAQRALALRLAHAAVDDTRIDTFIGKLTGKPVGTALGPHKEQRAPRTGRDISGHRNLVLFCHGEEPVLDGRGILRRIRDIVVDGVSLMAPHELINVAIQRRRKQERLVHPLDPVKDAFDLREKAKVGHLVSLINDDDCAIRDHGVAPLKQIVQPTGGRDYNVDPASHRIGLAVDGHAAINSRDTKAAYRRERRQLARNLACELARGDKHQRVGAMRRAFRRALDHGQPKSQRLARARACFAADIAASERVRNGERLDRKWVGDAGRCKRVNERVGDAQAGERRAGRRRGWAIRSGLRARLRGEG